MGEAKARFERSTAELEELRARNMQALADLDTLSAELRAVTGSPTAYMGIPEEGKMRIVVLMLVDFLFKPGTLQRIQFDITYEKNLWEQYLKDGVDQARAQLNQLKMRTGQGGIVLPGGVDVKGDGLYVPGGG